jgi:hypothetical protein
MIPKVTIGQNAMFLWWVISGDRPGSVEDLEDPIGVLQVGPPETAPAHNPPRSA